MSHLVRCSRYISCFKNPHFLKDQLLPFYFSTTTEENNKPTRPDPPPVRVGLTESAGRGVFATTKIGAGDLIHTAKPIVAHPTLSAINSVCYYCLKKLTLSECHGEGAAFCTQQCKEDAKEKWVLQFLLDRHCSRPTAFYDVELKADWLAFDDYCRIKGLKYPLLLKRLACMVISGAASAESLDILQPSRLSYEMVAEMEEGFGLLRSGFAKANFADEQTAFLTKEWFVSVLARIRVNAFRIELAVGSYDDLLSSAAAFVLSGGTC